MQRLYNTTIKLNVELYLDDEEVEDGIIQDKVSEAVEKNKCDIVGVEYEEMDQEHLLIEEQERQYDCMKGN